MGERYFNQLERLHEAAETASHLLGVLRELGLVVDAQKVEEVADGLITMLGERLEESLEIVREARKKDEAHGDDDS